MQPSRLSIPLVPQGSPDLDHASGEANEDNDDNDAIPEEMQELDMWRLLRVRAHTALQEQRKVAIQEGLKHGAQEQLEFYTRKFEAIRQQYEREFNREHRLPLYTRNEDLSYNAINCH